MARTRPHGWEIPGVDEETKQRLRMYALLHRMTLAQALKQLLEAEGSAA